MTAGARLVSQETEITVDDRGRIVSLRHAPTGTEFVTGKGSCWKMIATLGEWTEHPAFDHDQTGKIGEERGRIVVSFDRIKGLEAEYDVGLRIIFAAADPGIEIRWEIENRSPETVREFVCPMLAGLRGSAATIPAWCGARWMNPNETMPKSWVTGWAENPLTYPGTASMSWMHLESGPAGLYMGSHDSALPATALLVRRREKLGDLQMGFSRYPLAGPGEKFASGPFRLLAHPGDWRVGSAFYAGYASTWMRRPLARRSWLAEAPAICALFMKHQNGRRFFDFPRLAEIARDQERRGLAIPLYPFSWFKGGHDSGYPEYEPDPGMGGRDAMKKALREVRAAGSRTLLYTQGRLIDTTSDFFRKGPGWNAAYTAEGGNPHFDRYSWPIQSTIDPGKHFAVGCPGADEWRERLLHQADLIVELGADGLLYDQIGGDQPYLCFGKGHRHGRPDLAGASKVEILKQIRERLDAAGAALMLELTCDAFIQFTDLCHTKGSNFNDPGFPWPTFVEMYRYTFPDHALSARDAQLPEEIRYAWMTGMIPEYWRMIEPFEHVDRRFDLDEDQTEMKEYRAMMDRGRTEIETVIRVRQQEPIASAGFRATDGIAAGDPEVRLARYSLRGDAVLAWNAGDRGVTTSLDWDGRGPVAIRRVTEAGLTAAEPFSGPLRLAPGERAVLVRR